MPRPADLDREVTYTSHHRTLAGRYRLRAWHDERVCVVTELGCNVFPSITNAIEEVASSVEGVLAVNLVDPLGWRLYEHYPANGLRPLVVTRVHFNGRSGGTPTGPAWSPLSGDAWLISILDDREERS